MKMKLPAAALGLALAGPLAFAGDHAHWGYGGHVGPEHWADIDQNFQSCKLGKVQSPIDIDTSKVEKSDLKPIDFKYAASEAKIVNNGHTIQVDLPAGGAVTLDAAQYKLVQFHFHTPSEEKINGKAYPLVAHLVHKSAEGKLAVVAVLFKQGKENASLKPVFSSLPQEEGQARALAEKIDPAGFLPKDRRYYAFMGSLTTPPCSEEVRWQVLKTPLELSAGQIRAFKKLYSANARPVQPLNDRVVRGGQ